MGLLILALLPSTLAFSIVGAPRRAPAEAHVSAVSSQPIRGAPHCRMDGIMDMDSGGVAAATAPAAYIEFIIGFPEPCVPDVKLTRSRDGSTGVATFTFDNPSFLAAASEELGETTGRHHLQCTVCVQQHAMI